MVPSVWFVFMWIVLAEDPDQENYQARTAGKITVLGPFETRLVYFPRQHVLLSL